MKVTWHHDPVACWEMAKSYMEDGYDRFGKDQITTYVCARFPLADRFIVLVRLFKLACILDLFGLMNGAFSVLKQMEHLIAPSNTITLSRYIFGGKEYCENMAHLRKWCLKSICKHFDWLTKSEQWAQVLHDSVPDLEEQWIRITALKRIKTQEDLRRAIQRNLCDSNAIIKELRAADVLSKAPVQGETGGNKEPDDCLVTLKKESAFTKFSRVGTETPTRQQVASESLADLSKMQRILSFDDDTISESNVDDGGETHLSLPRDSSLRKVSNVGTCDISKDGDSVTGGGHVAPIARKSSVQEVFDVDVKHCTVSKHDKAAQQGVFKQTNDNFPIAGALNTSFSEPLLTSRRHGDINTNGKDSIIGRRKENNSLLQSANEDSKNIQRQETIGRSSQRGILLTLGTLHEPDSWPLADVPLPDPLLPMACRAPSLDSGAAQREQPKDATHHAQIVTVFGIHRPGMGGSIIPIDEDGDLSESRAKTANEAKAREFLGIDQPTTAGIAKSGSRLSLDSETKKLKKKTTWHGKHGE